MKIFLLLSLVFSAISGLFALTRHLQMLQQNSYFPSRYFAWLKIAFNKEFLKCALIYLFVSIFYMFRLYIVLCVIVLVLMLKNIKIAKKIQEQSIKKLVYTSRVKRIYYVGIALFVLLIAIYILWPTSVVGRLATAVLLLLSFVPPVLTFLLWLITHPIEQRISKYYIDDAKRILQSQPNLIVIGITGSYGKTTTKFILTRILSEKFNVVCTPQSYNTPMGVVRTVREKLKPQTQIFVCEMGAKNVGDIKEICDIAKPNHAIITSVGPQHLETFKTVENVFATKFELASAVAEKQGLTFVNGDSKEIINRIGNGYKVYGTDKNFEFCGSKITSTKNGSEFSVKLGGKNYKFTTKLLGIHSIVDIIGAISLAFTLGVPINDIQYAVASLKPTEHRLELKPFKNGSLLIDDAYNSNPEGCLEAVKVLDSFEGMKKVIVTPGLVELGDKEYECNFNLGKQATKYCDVIILVGKNRSKPMQDAVAESDFNTENLYVVSSFAEAMEIYSNLADSNTVVLFENDLPDNYLY